MVRDIAMHAKVDESRSVADRSWYYRITASASIYARVWSPGLMAGLPLALVLMLLMLVLASCEQAWMRVLMLVLVAGLVRMRELVLVLIRHCGRHLVRLARLRA